MSLLLFNIHQGHPTLAFLPQAMFPASPPSFLATKNLTLGDLTCSEILSWLITLTLELCPPQVSRDCWGGVRLLTLNITTRAVISNTDLPPPRISLNRHQPAGPVGMSPTLDFFPCICPWRLQSELRSPAICDKSHIQPEPLCLAAFMLPGSFKHCFLKSPSECRRSHLLKLCWPTCLTLHPSCLLPLTWKVNSVLITYSAAQLPLCSQSFFLFTACLRSLEQTVSLQRRDGARNSVKS